MRANTYTPFGLANEEETIPQPFQYVGQYGVMTEPNGLLYMRARYYDPTIGRFISEDPSGFAGGDVNLYAYVGGNPVMGVDPLGQKPPADIPPEVNIKKNIQEAQSPDMFFDDFYNAVKTNGKWDYKQQGSQYENFGNYHFGVVARAFGFREGFIKRGAGAYQILSGTSQTQWGNPLWRSPYGDDPNDQY